MNADRWTMFNECTFPPEIRSAFRWNSAKQITVAVQLVIKELAEELE